MAAELLDIFSVLKTCRKHKGSDVFIAVNKPICIKIDDAIKELETENLSPKETEYYAHCLMNDEEKAIFAKNKEINFSVEREECGRFRVNAFYQRGYVGAVLRSINMEVPSLKQLGLPSILQDLVLEKHGLIIVVGHTGSGKSTTISAMLDYRNSVSSDHIITVEDPIEYVYKNKKSIITQREIGTDTYSYDVALQNSLRQDPDVMLIGEARNQEVMGYALQFAETGHLCLTTVHASSANQALERIVNFFPQESRRLVLQDLAINLKAVIAQKLIPSASGHGVIPVVEIMLNTLAISDSIEKGEFEKIREYMTKGEADGMLTLDQSLYDLVRENKIKKETALKYANSKSELQLHFKLEEDSIGNGLDDVGLQE